MSETVKMLPRYRVPVVEKKQKTKRTHEEYVEELAIKNPTLEVVETYINAKTKIEHHCKVHDTYWKTSPSSVLQGKGCSLCKKEKIGKKHRMTHEEFLKELYGKNSNIQIDGKYINSGENIKSICKVCGHIWYPRASRLLQGYGCPNCAHQNLANKLRKTHEEFIEELRIINPYIRVIDKYITNHKKVTCICEICSHQWSASPAKLLSKQGCPSCNESIGERTINIFLSINKISYNKYHKYDGLVGVGGGLLSYDFYLPQYNLLIEFQGKQHEQPIEHFGGEEKFEIQQEHDKRKREYAKAHNINLLEIWYYDIDNIDTILEEYLNNLKLESVETTGVA